MLVDIEHIQKVCSETAKRVASPTKDCLKSMFPFHFQPNHATNHTGSTLWNLVFTIMIITAILRS